MKSNEIILVLIIFLIIVFSPLCLSKKMPLRKINFVSEIIIWINEIGEQKILSDEYNDYLPDEVLINDNIIENNKTKFYLNDTENKIVMRWNNLITYLVNIIKMDLSNFNTSKVIDMKYMFCDCFLLTSLNSENFDTSNVINMEAMFSGCESLISLNLNNFNTSSVTNMYSMFSYCENLIYLNISIFNTLYVEDMSYMFIQCKALILLDLSNFITSSVISMSSMFSNCQNLISLDISNFEISKAIEMDYMFSFCSSLISLDLNNFYKSSSIINMKNMFQKTNQNMIYYINIYIY